MIMLLRSGKNLKRKRWIYPDLYLKRDVSLLGDVFEKFQNNSIKNYELCWDKMFNMTKVKLELISDPDRHIFFDKGMRRGVSYISW